MKYIKILFTLCIIFLCMMNLSAEGIFLKNGKIIEGKISRESNTRIYYRDKRKQKKSISRSRVKRVMYGDEYKKFQYIYMTDGEILEGHIVGVDRKYYIIREKLNSTMETKILKKDVELVSPKKIKLLDLWDKWYIGGAFNFIVPTGTLYGGYSPGMGYAISLQNSHGKIYHIALNFSQSWYSAREDNSTDLSKMNVLSVSATGGYNFHLNGWIVLKPYLSAGYMRENVTYAGNVDIADNKSEKSYNSAIIDLGVQLPMRITSIWGRCIAPYIEYRWIPSFKHFAGFFNIGIIVQI